MKLSADEIESRAHFIHAILKSEVDREGDIYDPLTWVTTTEKQGVRVSTFRDTGEEAIPAFFVGDATGGCVYYNSGARPKKVCHYICHEVAHVLVAQKFTGTIRGLRTEFYHDDAHTWQHRVARRVEELIFGEVEPPKKTFKRR